MIPVIWLFLSATLPAVRAVCLPVAGDRILARDMTRSVPVFAGIAPDLVLGYAPAAGTRRTYGAAELARLARRYGLTVEPGAGACFARALEALTRERIAAVLQTVLPAASLEILEFSRQPVPPGELRFPLSGLGGSAAGTSTCLWRGGIGRAGQADFPVWAQVRIRMSTTRVVALEVLRPGRPVARSQLREESYIGPPLFRSLSQIVGQMPRRPIAAGEVIAAQWLEEPLDVVRGQRVRVEVRSGSARLVLEGQAQSSGRHGDVIGVRNLSNGKVFRATVEGRGRVSLVAAFDAAAGTGDPQ